MAHGSCREAKWQYTRLAGLKVSGVSGSTGSMWPLYSFIRCQHPKPSAQDSLAPIELRMSEPATVWFNHMGFDLHLNQSTGSKRIWGKGFTTYMIKTIQELLKLHFKEPIECQNKKIPHYHLFFFFLDMNYDNTIVLFEVHWNTIKLQLLFKLPFKYNFTQIWKSFNTLVYTKFQDIIIKMVLP